MHGQPRTRSPAGAAPAALGTAARQLPRPASLPPRLPLPQGARCRTLQISRSDSFLMSFCSLYVSHAGLAGSSAWVAARRRSGPLPGGPPSPATDAPRATDDGTRAGSTPCWQARLHARCSRLSGAPPCPSYLPALPAQRLQRTQWRQLGRRRRSWLGGCRGGCKEGCKRWVQEMSASPTHASPAPRGLCSPLARVCGGGGGHPAPDAYGAPCAAASRGSCIPHPGSCSRPAPPCVVAPPKMPEKMVFTPLATSVASVAGFSGSGSAR